MPPAAATLLAAALELPDDERRELAHALLASTEGDDPATVNAAWGKEIHARIAARDAGLAPSRPWAEVRAEIVADLAARREARDR